MSNKVIAPRRPEDIAELEQRHRDVMLDLILTWGALDGALGVMLSRALGLSLPEGANAIGRLSSSRKFEEIRKLLRDRPGGQEASRLLRQHMRDYNEHSYPRNRIAHSKCLGVHKDDPDLILFTVFERVGQDNLALDMIPIQVMVAAIQWGRAMTDAVFKIADVLDPDIEHKGSVQSAPSKGGGASG